MGQHGWLHSFLYPPIADDVDRMAAGLGSSKFTHTEGELLGTMVWGR